MESEFTIKLPFLTKTIPSSRITKFDVPSLRNTCNGFVAPVDPSPTIVTFAAFTVAAVVVPNDRRPRPVKRRVREISLLRPSTPPSSFIRAPLSLFTNNFGSHTESSVLVPIPTQPLPPPPC